MDGGVMMPSDIPKAREMLEALAIKINCEDVHPFDVAREIRAAVKLMSRDRPVRRARKQRRTPVKSEVKEAIIVMAKRYPDMTLDAIGVRHGTSGARVSEIIRGLKSQEPEHLPRTQEELRGL